MAEDLTLDVEKLQQMPGMANMHSAETTNLEETENDIKQERDAPTIDPAYDEKSDEIEMEPSKVADFLPTIGEHEKVEIDSLSRYKSLCFQYSSSLKSPMKNSVLHIAARNGKDEIIDLVDEHDPDLFFIFNKNNDSPLHLAIRAGNISTVIKLLATYANLYQTYVVTKWRKYNGSIAGYNSKNMFFQQMLIENDKGNNIFHEAMICDKGSIGAKVFKAYEPYMPQNFVSFTMSKTNNAKQSVLYLAVEAADKEVVELILNKCLETVENPEGLSPVEAAIMKKDIDMLSMILRMKPNWIHLADKHGRLPLHYAALKGYFEGVHFLHDKCNCCHNIRDEYGFFPLHLASHGGHVKVVKELLSYCPDPTQMVDNFHRNILHIAAKNGKHEVVRYILQTPKLDELINQKDHNKGDTPVHLAARSCHTKTIFYLTWDKRVDLGLVNDNNQTPLDIVNALYQHSKPSMRQQLTWTSLKSAGAKPNSIRVLSHESRSIDLKSKEEINNDKVSDHERYKDSKPKVKMDNVSVFDPERYKDRVETLTVVSTLIITASVASCLGVPGGADGTATSLYHVMFQLFIICITLSFFTSVSATIILFWARLGLIELLDYSLKIVMPILGVSLISLSFAFLAGVYTVISKLRWFATLFLVMTGIFIGVVFFLYIILFLPSTSTKKPLRYISYYPFLFLASLAEPKTNHRVDS